jgi:hypothetical protein
MVGKAGKEAFDVAMDQTDDGHSKRRTVDLGRERGWYGQQQHYQQLAAQSSRKKDEDKGHKIEFASWGGFYSGGPT